MRLSIFAGAILLLFASNAFAVNNKLVVTELNKREKIRTCATTGEKYEELRVIVRRAAATLNKLVVIFGNGDREVFQFRRRPFDPGQKTRWVDLGRERCIRAVVVRGVPEDPNTNPKIVIRGRYDQQLPPPPVDDHLSDLYQGDQVYNTARDAFAEIVAEANDGTFVIRFTSGPLSGVTGSNWGRQDLAIMRGCNDLCVGDSVYNTDRGMYAEVIGLQTDGNYVLTFTSGNLSGLSGDNWERDSLAAMSGCHELCVGDTVYNISRDMWAEIVGIETDGDYVLRFTSGNLSGLSGHNWTRSELATTSGCNDGLCVGDSVYNTARNAYADIIAIQEDGLFVLRFTSGSLSGLSGSNWSSSDLIKL